MTKIIFLLTLYNYTIKINTIKIVVYGLSEKKTLKE